MVSFQFLKEGGKMTRVQIAKQKNIVCFDPKLLFTWFYFNKSQYHSNIIIMDG